MNTSWKFRFVSVLLLFCSTTFFPAGAWRLVCLDEKEDFARNKWSLGDANTISDYNFVESAKDLPISFGPIRSSNYNGILYYTGKKPSKKLELRSPTDFAPKGAKSAKMFIRYFDNASRRLSVQPSATPSGSILLLPPSVQAKWTEKSFDLEIATTQEPIEISTYLGPNEFVLIEKIIIAIDTPLPLDTRDICNQLPTLATTKAPSNILKSLTPSTDPKRQDKGASSSCAQVTTTTTKPECTCNCNCNCQKLCS